MSIVRGDARLRVDRLEAWYLRAMKAHLRLGCPVWACPSWRGHLYTAKASPADYLAQYAEVFDCVEGNSTFYALPSFETVDRWRQATPEGFHFCFKFPRAITHDRTLVDAQRTTEAFFERLVRLPHRLGPLLLQLPPGFGPSRLDDLDRYLAGLPREFTYAVEVRHPDFFGGAETQLNHLLAVHSVARGLMDTRAVHAATAPDATTVVSQSRKPKVPWRTHVTSDRPFVRIVGQNDVKRSSGYLDQWADVVAGWLTEGWSPHVFMHAPDDFYAPRLARALHHLVRRRVPDLPEHPSWPGERPTTVQLGLL